MLFNYQPLPAFTPSTIAGSAVAQQTWIEQSQRPHIWIYPQNSAGGEMTLPFFWPKHWLNTQVNQEFLDMGQLNLIDYTGLVSANGTTGAPVTIQIYAWAENVQLSGPSVGLALQGDEYGTGIVSAPASAIANIAGRLATAPIIGKFARATQIGASAIAGIAKLFGWTNVPVIADVQPFRPTAFSQLATTSIGYPKEKLTLDPKNEVSVDPSIIGLPAKDELELSYLFQKESYLTTAVWNTSDAPNTVKFTSLVTPEMYSTESITSGIYVHDTPMSWASLWFASWRGDIIFRFRVIASQYHKGRLIISWDPAGTTTSNLDNKTETTAVVSTTIMDLGECSEVEVRIPYNQALPFLECQQLRDTAHIPWALSAPGTYPYDSKKHNGFLTLRVLTELSAPVASSAVSIQVFVRGADNLEVANPGYANWQHFSPAQFSLQGEDCSQVTMAQEGREDNARYLLNFGERVASLRPMLHRMANLMAVPYGTGVGTGIAFCYDSLNRTPPTPGYDPNGLFSAKGLIATSSNFPYNFVNYVPLTWYMQAFVAQRGAINWTLNNNATNLASDVRISRVPVIGATPPSIRNYQATGSITSSSGAKAYNAYTQNMTGGGALTHQATNAGLEVSLPFYSIYKFVSTNARMATNPGALGIDQTDVIVYNVVNQQNATTENNGLREYFVGAGTDFNVFWFLNCPTHIAAADPVAN